MTIILPGQPSSEVPDEEVKVTPDEDENEKEKAMYHVLGCDETNDYKFHNRQVAQLLNGGRREVLGRAKKE